MTCFSNASPSLLNEQISPSNIDVEVITEQKDLKSFNVNNNILDGFQIVQEQPSKVHEEIKMEDEPLMKYGVFKRN